MSLIRRDGAMPPGGYYFQDPKTGMKFEGMSATFAEQVGTIISHRMANPKIYPATEPQFLNWDSVANELDVYTCTRLGNHPSFCFDPNSKPAANVPRIVVAECPKCRGALIERTCPTCAGRRVIGWKCSKCGYEIDK